MNRIQLMKGLIAILAVSVGIGLTRRFLEAGWPDRALLESQVEQLHQLPETVGDWVRIADAELPDHAKRILNCHGFINQSYRNAQTGAKVSMAVLYGPRGPIAVHTPEICYSGVGTRPVGERKVAEIATQERLDRFWTLLLSRGSDPTPSIEVWYSWSDGGPWIASEHPRFWMTDSLYKIQLAGEPAKENTESDCKNFLKSLLPILRQKLRSS